MRRGFTARNHNQIDIFQHNAVHQNRVGDFDLIVGQEQCYIMGKIAARCQTFRNGPAHLHFHIPHQITKDIEADFKFLGG